MSNMLISEIWTTVNGFDLNKMVLKYVSDLDKRQDFDIWNSHQY